MRQSRSASLDSSFARVFLPSFAQLWGFAKNLRRIGGKNISCARRKKTKKTSENAAALCAFAPLSEKYPRQKTLFVQSPISGALSRRNDGTGQVPLTRRRALSSLMPWTHNSLHNLCLQANIRFATYVRVSRFFSGRRLLMVRRLSSFDLFPLQKPFRDRSTTYRFLRSDVLSAANRSWDR